MQIVDAVRATQPPPGMHTRVIAVDGPGGAGKSTFAAALAERLGGAQIAHTDDFASWEVPLDWWPRLLDELLRPLARNETARYRCTDWAGTGEERLEEVHPAEFVILEGVSASREAFRPFLAYAVWIETPREVRLARGLERDGEAALPQWERWMAAEDAWVARERPHEHADVVVDGR